MVEPSFAEKSVVNHRDYATNCRIVTSRAVSVNETEVLTADGSSIAYNYLFIATGHSDYLPKTRTERLEDYQAGTSKHV